MFNPNTRQQFETLVFQFMAFSIAVDQAVERAAKELELNTNEKNHYEKLINRKVNNMNRIRSH